MLTKLEKRVYEILAECGFYAYVQPEAKRYDKYRICLDYNDGVEPIAIAESREELLLKAIELIELTLKKQKKGAE